MNLRDARELAESLEADPDVRAVFGERYQTPDGATVIPVTKPVGVFVVKDGKPTWAAARNDTLIALLGVLVGLVSATLAGVTMVRRPPWPDLHGEITKRL